MSRLVHEQYILACIVKLNVDDTFFLSRSVSCMYSATWDSCSRDSVAISM